MVRGVVGPPGLRRGCAPRAQRGRWPDPRPSAKLRVCALVAARWCVPGWRRVPRHLRLLALSSPTPCSFPTSQTSLYGLPFLGLSDPLQGTQGNFCPPGSGHHLPGTPRVGEIAPPISLATLEAVNESLWGILLNFSNQVSSDLMPSV